MQLYEYATMQARMQIAELFRSKVRVWSRWYAHRKSLLYVDQHVSNFFCNLQHSYHLPSAFILQISAYRIHPSAFNSGGKNAWYSSAS